MTRPTFLLEVADDALSDELGVPDHVEDLLVLALDQRQLELVLRRVHRHRARLALTVQQEHLRRG